MGEVGVVQTVGQGKFVQDMGIRSPSSCIHGGGGGGGSFTVQRWLGTGDVSVHLLEACRVDTAQCCNLSALLAVTPILLIICCLFLHFLLCLLMSRLPFVLFLLSGKLVAHHLLMTARSH